MAHGLLSGMLSTNLHAAVSRRSANAKGTQLGRQPRERQQLFQHFDANRLRQMHIEACRQCSSCRSDSCPKPVTATPYGRCGNFSPRISPHKS